MKKVTVDASVALKWFLADEEYGTKAVNLLSDYISGKLDLIAPSLLEYEVLNGLLIAGKRGRIKEEEILSALDGFSNLELTLKHISQLSMQVFKFCRIYNCSVYDAAYLAVAVSESVPLLTADEKLYNSVKKNLKWVKWIGNI